MRAAVRLRPRAGATALRAQLGGRIVHRVNDNDTARMVLHGFTDEAVQAALTIDLPGVAVIADTRESGWARARGTDVGPDEVTAVAAEWADAAVTWEELFGSPPDEDVRRLAVA
ncbi:MAG: hypothetical protein ACJ73S_28120 [Mycobacteriales bacterium]